MKCKKCGSDVIAESIMTNPPYLEYRCLNCGFISEDDVEFEIANY